jgi:hypothetical protein
MTLSPPEAIRAFLHDILRGFAPLNSTPKRIGKFTKRCRPDARKRKHLRDIQKMSRVKNRAA